MPESKDNTAPRYEFCGGHVCLCEGDRVVEDICDVRRRGAAARERAVAKRIADALNAAEENRDRPWEGNGPTLAEAGGKSILVRIEDDLCRATWESYEGIVHAWVIGGWRVAHLPKPATGWRPMPKAS